MGIKTRISRHFFPDAVAAAAIRRFPPASGLVLMYHEVLPDDIALPAWTVVRESDFHQQMQCLATHFDVVSLDEAVDRVSGKAASTRPFAVVTFDDGYQGNARTVLPIMERMGLPFTVYAATRAIVENDLYWYDRIISALAFNREIRVTVKVDGTPESYTIPSSGEDGRWVHVQRLLSRMKLMPAAERDAAASEIAADLSLSDSPLKMLTEEELRLLSASSCVTIGCHTHGHELLDRISPREAGETLRLSSDLLTRITGTHPRHFAYPNGNVNQVVRGIVQQSGFETAVTTASGLWSGEVSMMEIPRVGVGRFETITSFKALISRWV